MDFIVLSMEILRENYGAPGGIDIIALTVAKGCAHNSLSVLEHCKPTMRHFERISRQCVNHRDLNHSF
jgi:hypothetical protein